MPPRYVLEPNDVYGWWTGLTADRHQALMGLDINAEICVLFDSEGRMIRAIERCFDRDGSPVEAAITNWPFHLTDEGAKVVNARFENWLAEIIVHRRPILVEEFGLDDRFIGIEPMPAEYAEFLENPESAAEEDRKDLAEAIEEWKRLGCCVFWWNEDYHLNPDGTVASH